MCCVLNTFAQLQCVCLHSACRAASCERGCVLFAPDRAWGRSALLVLLLCGVWLRAASVACLGFRRGRNTDVRTFVSCQGGLYNKRKSIYRCSRLTPPSPSAPSSPLAAAAALLRVLFALEATLVRGRAVNCNALRVPAREAEHWQLAASDTARQQRQATSDNAC